MGRSNVSLLRPVVCTLLLGCVAPVSRARATFIEGYASRQSVAPGDSLTFHVRTDAPAFDLVIVRQAAVFEPMLTIEDLPGTNHAVPDSAFWYGCDWPATCLLVIPDDWPSGVYLGKLDAPDAWAWTIFVVREAEPGTASRTLFMVSDNTWQAYNAWGGKSVYGANSTNGVPSVKVTFDRPYDGGGYGRFFKHGAAQFVRWAAQEVYEFEFASNSDLGRAPDFLSHYDLVLSVGHDEYWSLEMREQLEAFRDRGGNLGFFTANAIYWQVRYEQEMRLMACFKDSLTDPLYGIDDARVTVRWRDPPVNRPEAALMGVQHFPRGCCCGDSLCVWQGQPAAIADPDHWILDGTGAGPGDSLGTVILGWEWDHTLSGVTPAGAEIVLEAWPLDSNGTPNLFQAVYFEAGGKVFAAGTVQWGLGLSSWWGCGFSDPDVQQATRNILAELQIPGQSATVDERPVSPPAGAELRVRPNPARRSVQITVDLDRREWVTLDLYDVAGRHVRRLLGSSMGPGAHEVTSPLAAGDHRFARGVYYLRSNVSMARSQRKLVVVGTATRRGPAWR